MKYDKIVKARFIERENRFVASVELTCNARNGENSSAASSKGDNAGSSASHIVKAHVKNTGRCRELLLPGAVVYLEDHVEHMGSRKMRYSLVAVEKETSGGGKRLINMDSQAPNKVVGEALADGRILLPGLTGGPEEKAGKPEEDAGKPEEKAGRQDGAKLSLIKPETRFGDSRFDFYVEQAGPDGSPAACAFLEVKGVTLEENGHARFPDAPTERGVKHINELIRAREEGYGAYIIFVVQMEEIEDVSPNNDTHPAFGEALAKAQKAGVKILAYDCAVTPDSLQVKEPVRFTL